MANVDIRLGHKTAAFFAANPTLVLKDGQLMVVSDGANIGKYKIGDGTTQLQNLTFYGGVSTTPAWGVITGTITDQTDLVSYVASGAITFTNKTGNISQWTNNVGYLTGITSGQVTTALGFTPYNATNPSGYITNAVTTLSSLTSIGTIGTGVWQGTAIGDTYISSAATWNGKTTLAAVNAQNLSVFAATTSAQLAGVISDETGSGALVFGASPTFTTDITTPLIIGGTAAGSTLSLKGTSGTGTATVAAINFLVGTNGGTTAAKVYNNGQFNIGNAVINPASLGILRIGQGTSFLDIGEHSSGNFGMWANQTTPSTTNYFVEHTGTICIFNASSQLQFRTNNSTAFACSTTQVIFNNSLAPSDNVHFIFGTSGGSKIGTGTTQKIGFWNKTPIVQPTTGITGAALVGGGGTAITSTDTFGGYTLQQLAAILINTGLAA